MQRSSWQASQQGDQPGCAGFAGGQLAQGLKLLQFRSSSEAGPLGIEARLHEFVPPVVTSLRLKINESVKAYAQSPRPL